MAVGQTLTVRQASDELRYLVRRLRSPIIEQLGFLGALEDHLGMFGERAGAATELRVDGEPRRLPADVEHAAFRVIQEALTNAEKYAEATTVEVRVGFGEGSIECVVRDDGRGFDPAATKEPGADGGFGLVGMRERTASAGGELTVDAAPGRGVTITFRAPLPPEGEGDAEGPPADR
jgi:signal transduction histidine kinase